MKSEIDKYLPFFETSMSGTFHKSIDIITAGAIRHRKNVFIRAQIEKSS